MSTSRRASRSPRAPRPAPRPAPRAWADLTTHERTAYLVPLLGRAVAYVLADELRQGHAIFGPAFPVPWQYGTAVRLVPLDGQPAVCFAVPDDDLPGLRDTSVLVPFAQLYDVRPSPRDGGI